MEETTSTQIYSPCSSGRVGGEGRHSCSFLFNEFSLTQFGVFQRMSVKDTTKT